MSKEVLSLEAEEVSIDMVINDALVKMNITEAKIAELKQKYGGLTINGQSDREGYDSVVEARKECKGWRVMAKKICTKGREEAKNIMQAWIAKEKDVVGRISETEDYLEKLETEWENERERIKQEKKRLQEEGFILRQAALSKLGATYIDGNFVLGEVSYDAPTIKETDNDIWEQNILPQYQEQYEKIQAVKVEEERKKQEAEAELQRQREELERQQNELREAQAAMQREKEAAEKKEQERIALETKKLKEANNLKFTERLSFLKGWEFDGLTVYYKQHEVFGKKEDLYSISEQEFQQLVADNNKYLEQKAKEDEEKKQAELKIAQEKAAQEERKRIEEEQKQAEIKRQQEEQKKAEELALANDKTKWAAFVKNLQAITHSEMKSPKYKRMQTIAKEKLEEIFEL